MKLESANLHQHTVSSNIEKSWSFNDSIVKNSIAYTTVIIFVFASIGYLFASLPARFADTGGKYFFVLLYMLTGIAHVFTFPKWLPQLHDIKGFFYSILLSVVINAFIFFLFTDIPFNAGMFPFAAACAFVLPSAVKLCWQYFTSIPERTLAAWVMPADMQPETRMSLLLNSLFFHVKIKIKEADAAGTVFPVTLPARLTVAEIFCRFLYDQKGRIAVTAGDEKQYAWRFYSKTWLGKKPLDAMTSLSKNNIKEGDTIIIERS
jgi:hypothetical protein